MVALRLFPESLISRIRVRPVVVFVSQQPSQSLSGRICLRKLAVEATQSRIKAVTAIRVVSGLNKNLLLSRLAFNTQYYFYPNLFLTIDSYGN